MADSDETNQLLREIRDILASQQDKYDDHLKKLQAAYAEQVKTSDGERKKSVLIIFLCIIVLGVILTMSVQIF